MIFFLVYDFFLNYIILNIAFILMATNVKAKSYEIHKNENIQFKIILRIVYGFPQRV